MRAQARAVAVAAALLLATAGAAWPQPLTSPAQPPQPQPSQPAEQTAASACEAPTLAWLVGKPRSAIPVPVNPALRRVYCSTCLVTQDYVPSRTDIVFDSQTGLITQVKCG